MSGRGKKTTKSSGEDREEKLAHKQTQESSEVSKEKASTSSNHTPNDDEKIEAIDLTKDKAARIINVKPKNTSGDPKYQKEEVVSEDISKSNKDEAAQSKENKPSNTNEKDSLEDDSKNHKGEAVIKNKKDSTIKNKGKGKAVKTDSTSKKKKGITSKKKVRSVQDQEIPEKKQTSLTDHFQVRRSERKLKTLGDDEARMALRKQIISGIEDGLEIKVLEEKGRGIFTSKNFIKGNIVCEYAGELISIQEAKERELEYEETPEVGSYMYFFQYKNQKYCVDATRESNRLGRLVNHSKTSSNVYTKVFPINDIPHLILIASRDIEVGEEVLYDYGDRSKKSLDSHPWLKC